MKEGMKKLFLQPGLCRTCGGECCKKYPGIYSPTDFGKTRKKREDNIQIALSNGRIAMDWWDGDPRKHSPKNKVLSQCYFLRPAIKGKENILEDPAWGGECTFLTEKGCELPPKKRPLGCRMLEPKGRRENCLYHGKGKRQEVMAWLRYQGFFDLMLEMKKKSSKDDSPRGSLPGPEKGNQIKIGR